MKTAPARHLPRSLRALLPGVMLMLSALPAPALAGAPAECGRCLRFQTEHLNTPAPARRAFAYVERIWSSRLVSDVPVRIRVSFRPLKAKATTIPNVLRGFDGAADATWYPSALADAMAGLDQDHRGFDMEIFFSDSVEWYYGTDGMVPDHLVDFVSVALHEVAHGLGFASRIGMRKGGAFRGLDSGRAFPELSFQVPDPDGMPTIFDRHLETEEGRRVMEVQGQHERSLCLGRAVLDGKLFFGGRRAALRNGGKRPLLSASDPSHVDQKAYQWTRDGLMTPRALAGRAVHEPGAIVLGVLEDLGWEVRALETDPVLAGGEDQRERIEPDSGSVWTWIH